MQPSLASVLQDASWLGLCHSRRLSDSPADHALQTRAAIAEPPPSVTVAFRDRPVDICQGHCETTNLLAAPDDPSPRCLATDSTMSSSAGVSELMDAEKKASTVVAEARAARSDRLKAAKAEAGAAVDDLRAARESEHALTTSSDSDAKEAQAISAKADGEIQAMKALFEANKGSVAQLLVAQTTHVDTSVSETRALAGNAIDATLLDGVAMSVPHRAPDWLVDFHTGLHGVLQDQRTEQRRPEHTLVAHLY